MAYYNESFVPPYPAFKSAAGTFYTGAPNGLRTISKEGPVSFTVGGLNNSNERLTILTNGNIGISQTVPNAKLQVADG